jgi:hypothetical protein
MQFMPLEDEDWKAPILSKYDDIAEQEQMRKQKFVVALDSTSKLDATKDKKQGQSLEVTKTFGSDYQQSTFKKRVRKQGDPQTLMKEVDAQLLTKQ